MVHIVGLPDLPGSPGVGLYPTSDTMYVCEGSYNFVFPDKVY